MKVKKARKRTKFGIELAESARQILAHMRGELDLPVLRFVVPAKRS